MAKTKGSEWRKWDLHIHSPLSFLENQYNGDWDNWIKQIVENDIKAIGLTNYFKFNHFEGEREIDIVRKKLASRNILVLPNLEFRLAQPNKDGDYINLHILFSENVDTKKIDDFLNRLKLEDGSYCSHLSLNNDFIGATIAKKELENKLNEDFKRHQDYLIVCCPNGYGGFRANNKEGRSVAVANMYDKLADFFFARQQDRDYFLGKDRYEGCIPKAVAFCSDAHKLAGIGGEKYSWIKADLTFEGLKQILFEPDQRIKIQNEKPNYKEDRLIVEEIKFHSSNKKFGENSIFLNENLNVVIGGKSSGKSILLYNIAKTLLADKDFFKKEELENKYNFRIEDPKFNFEIKTKGGFSQFLYRDSQENSIIPEIKYISQNYLIKLADPGENKKGDALNKIIRDLIKEDLDSQRIYNDFLSSVKSNDRKREAIVDSYFEIKDKIALLEQQIKLTSNKEVLEENIKSNNDKVAELNKSAGMTDEQINIYSILQSQADANKLERTQAGNDFNKIKQFNHDTYGVLNSLRNKASLLSNSLENEKFKQYFDDEYFKVDTLLQQFDLFIQLFELNESNQFKKSGLISNIFSEIQQKKKEIDNNLEPYLKNKEIEKQIEEILKSIGADRASLQSIEQLSKEIANNKAALIEEKNKLFALYEENVNLYISVISNLKSRTIDLEKDGLKIQGIAKFNFKKFRESLLGVSDGRSASYAEYNICKNDKDSLTSYELPILVAELKKIFLKLVETEEYVLLGKTGRKGAIKILLDDYFFDYWQIEYKNDTLGKMSTGKASFVILMLIVGLSKSKAPILIDQPEDNLDNRSITSDLVEYLKNKKLERQIILVTHNANIVVNADAENIIVANQKGQSDKTTNSAYQFDYINGALENSFPMVVLERNLLKSMGIREHVADIVEGGKDAFKKREEKYGFKLFR